MTALQAITSMRTLPAMQSESTVMALRATGRWTESKARRERRGVFPSRRHPPATRLGPQKPAAEPPPLSFRGPPRNLAFRSCPIANSEHPREHPRPLCHSEVPRGISPSGRAPSPTQNTHESTHDPPVIPRSPEESRLPVMPHRQLRTPTRAPTTPLSFRGPPRNLAFRATHTRCIPSRGRPPKARRRTTPLSSRAPSRACR